MGNFDGIIALTLGIDGILQIHDLSLQKKQEPTNQTSTSNLSTRS